MSKYSILREFPFMLVSLAFSKRRVLFFHGWNNEEYSNIQSSFFLYFILKFMLDSSHIVCVLSQKFRDELIQLGVNSTKVVRLTTMVDTKSYTRKSNLSKSPEYNTILFCSQPITKEKGVFEFADCIDDLVNEFPKLRINFLGGFEKIKDLRDKYTSKEYKSKINFLGFQSGKIKNNHILSSDILILPSYSEGLPSIVLEAMAAGLCIVSTPVGGLKDILLEKHNSIVLTSPPNSKNIKESLVMLLSNPKLMDHIKKVNYVESRHKYDSKIVSTKIESLYCRLLN